MKKRKTMRNAAIGIAASALAASMMVASGCSNETVYGPPDDVSYSSEDNIPVAVYGPPEDFYDPESNSNVDVYGPPEDMYEPEGSSSIDFDSTSGETQP